MNRDELASLLATTHSAKHSSSSANRSPIRSQRSRENPTSPTSPRQIFQSRVRTLSHDENLPTAQQPSPTRRSHELQRLSSLRVHVRDSDGLSHSHHTRRSHRYRSKDGRFGFSAIEPDFVAEERAAWNREREEKAEDLHEVSAARGEQPMPRDKSLSSQVDQHEDAPLQQVPIMKTFGPASEPVDPNDRPKTSRGHKSEVDALPRTFSQEAARPTSQAIRRSKFLEGSMSDRSVGIASTWNDNGLRLSESYERSEEAEDSDATPRASHASRDSCGSVDVSELRPTPTTPSTVKGKLSKLVKRPNEDSTKPHDAETRHKKRGLRKSISTWSFHNIGDKMKFFGASSYDLAGDRETSHKQGPILHFAEHDERKRKAEDAYTRQFGTKKQKSNDQIPVHDSLRPPTQPRTLKKRSVSERQITPTTVTRRQWEAAGSRTRSSRDLARNVSDSEHDGRRRPSRSELEKENQHLRAMLYEQQAQRVETMHRSASRSNMHLPIDNSDHVASTRSVSCSASRGRSMPETSSIAKSTKQKQSQSKDIPPVPALPSRAVLASLGSSGRNAGLPPADTGTMKRVKDKFLRPVSMIIEEDVERYDRDGTKEQCPREIPSPRSQTHVVRARKETWEWPDDVF